jgi:hypothetical protein
MKDDHSSLTSLSRRARCLRTPAYKIPSKIWEHVSSKVKIIKGPMRLTKLYSFLMEHSSKVADGSLPTQSSKMIEDFGS